MSTTVQPHSVKTLLGEKARKYRSFNSLCDDLDALFDEVPHKGALQRIYKIANAQYQDRDAQVLAITAAMQEARAAVAPPARAVKNIEAFQREMWPSVFLSEGEPLPQMETNRPYWADPDCDAIINGMNGHDGTDKIGCNQDFSWRSKPITIPIVGDYYGRISARGSFESARIMADVRQAVTDRSPQIAFERHGFKESTDGKVQTVVGIDRYTLTLTEAANLARGLLLLIDLATGTTDDIAGA